MPTSRAKIATKAGVIGVGSYLPNRVLTNADLEKKVETSDEWIRTRTGIRERRIAAPNESTSDMAIHAAKKALRYAKISADEIDLILVATVTPDTTFPATASYVQHHIGATHAVALDLSAACAGFLVGWITAQQFIKTGAYQTVLVIGAEKLSSIINWQDRNTCVLFGDGAGAVLLRASQETSFSFDMGTKGALTDILLKPAGGSRLPVTPENIHERLDTIQMSGKEVYRHAVSAMSQSAKKALKSAGLQAGEIDWVIPHQANLRIITAVADRLHLPLDRFLLNLERYGNTSAACIPIALDEACREGKIQPGQRILMVAFGSGLTWASVVFEW